MPLSDLRLKVVIQPTRTDIDIFRRIIPTPPPDWAIFESVVPRQDPTSTDPTFEGPPVRLNTRDDGGPATTTVIYNAIPTSPPNAEASLIGRQAATTTTSDGFFLGPPVRFTPPAN